MPHTTLAMRLRAARGSMPQKEVARRAHIDPAYLCRLESGKQPLSSKTWKGWKKPRALHDVAAVLGVNPDWLVTGEGTPDLPPNGSFAYLRPALDLLSMLSPIDYARLLGHTGLVPSHATVEGVQHCVKRGPIIDQLTPEERDACATLIWALMEIRHSDPQAYRDFFELAQDIINHAPIKRQRARALLRQLGAAEARAQQSRKSLKD